MVAKLTGGALISGKLRSEQNFIQQIPEEF